MNVTSKKYIRNVIGKIETETYQNKIYMYYIALFLGLCVRIRLAPSLCISYSTKSDIHGIIMTPQMGGDITVRDEILLSAHILVKKPYSPHIIH